MTEPSKEARQRCADLANVEEDIFVPEDFGCGGEPEARAFARFVQQTSDTMREIVRWTDPDWHPSKTREALDRIEALARTFILPEPEVDPLVEALKEALKPNILPENNQYARALRDYFAKSGKVIKIEEAE